MRVRTAAATAAPGTGQLARAPLGTPLAAWIAAGLAAGTAVGIATVRTGRSVVSADMPDTPDTPDTGGSAPATQSLTEVLDGTTDLLLLTDADDVVVYASTRCRELLGVAPEQLLHGLVTETVEPGDRVRVAEQARIAREHPPGRRSSIAYAALLATGETRLVEADVTAVDRPGAGRGLVWAVRDLGPRVAHDLAAGSSGLHDQLTGLPNRAMLVESLGRALARADRSHTRLAAVVVGIDQFKQTWEVVGHRAAEELLLSAAGRLQSVVRPGDLVARSGVDEFALLLDGFRDVDEVVSLTRAALLSLSRPVHAGSRCLTIGASAGIAVGGAGADSSVDLIDQAVVAGERARHERPGDALVYEESMLRRGHRAPDLTADLQHAIRSGQIRAVFQPIVQLDTGRLSGFEALARWDHPTRGPVSPAAFITLAEETGLIVDLGRQILLAACRQVELWRTDFPQTLLRIGVNVSPRQLAGSTLVDDVRQALRMSGLPAEHLVLEITESAVHHDMAGVQHTLGQLRHLGVRTAMDDFGTGYSSLAYLRRLPLDILKIDKSFIDDRDGSGPRLMAAVIGIGNQLGLDTVAEGIEDAEQLDAVVAAGCTFGQGYLISRPLEPDDATRLVGIPDRFWTRD